jgi:hypothetical protein
MIVNSKNKIVEVLAYAREVSIRHGHTRKYAKHLVALAIKQMMQLTDRELAVFLSENDIGKILNYKQPLLLSLPATLCVRFASSVCAIAFAIKSTIELNNSKFTFNGY